MSDDDLTTGWDWSSDKNLDHGTGRLNNFTGTVRDAYFVAGDYSMQLILRVEPTEWEDDQEWDPNASSDEENDGCLGVYINVGSNWETLDGGQTVQHTSGNLRKRFHATSIYGKLLGVITGEHASLGENATATDPEVPVAVDMAGLAEHLADGGLPPSHAEIWKGHSFFFQEIEFDYGKNRKTGEEMKSVRTLPTQWKGYVGEDEGSGSGSASKPAAKKASTRKPAAAKKADPEPETETEDAEETPAPEPKKRGRPAKKAAAPSITAGQVNDLIQQFDLEDFDDDDINGHADFAGDIAKLVAESADYETFKNAAFALDGADENELVMTLIDDEEDGYWSLKGGE